MSLFTKVNNLQSKLKSKSNAQSPQPENTWGLNHSDQINNTNGMVVNRPRAYTDPQTCFEVFKSHWCQAWAVINKSYNNATSNNVAISRSPQQEIDTVLRYVDQMMLLLVEEEDQDGAQGPILEYMLEEDLLCKLFDWSNLQTEFVDKLKYHHLKTVDLLISQARQLLLVHKPIIRPLLQLLNSCEAYPNSNIEQHLILVLHQLCVAVTQNTHLLELLFSASSDQGSARFLIFSLLIPYIHHEGTIGQQARDALLLIMALSSRHENIGQYIAQNSDFCPVLATGLSGLYSSLPRKLEPPSDDWYQITQDDLNKCQSLLMFLNSLEFCNAVVQVSHPLVAEQLLTFILQGFLIPVMGPALHQSSMEEVIAATAYLDLFIRRITEPALLCVFIRFVIAEKYDDSSILDSLIARIQSSSRLCMVTLSLFKTLVDLNCEDVMFQLVFRYLIPCTHVMVSQRRAVRDLDLYGKTAEKLLSLKPHCCASLIQADQSLASLPRSREGSVSSQGSPQITPVSNTNFSFTSLTNTPNVASGTPKKRLWGKFSKNSSKEQMNTSSSSPVAPPSPSPSLKMLGYSNSTAVSHRPVDSQYFQESNYMDYLASAHIRIEKCAIACEAWAVPYDGEMPSSDSLLNNDDNTVDESVLSSSQADVHVDTGGGGDSVDNPKDTGAHIQNKEPNSTEQTENLIDKQSNTTERTKNLIDNDHNGKTVCNNVKNKNDTDIKSENNNVSIIEKPNSDSNIEGISCNESEQSSQCNTAEMNGKEVLNDSVLECDNMQPIQSINNGCYADSVVSEADSGLCSSSTNIDQAEVPKSMPVSRSDSPLSDHLDNTNFNSFLLSLKRIQTPVEYSDSMETCLKEIDSLVAEYKNYENIRKTTMNLNSFKVRTSITECILTPSPCDENKTFGESLLVTSPSFSLDLSKASYGTDSIPVSMSLDSLSLAATSPVKRTSVNALSINNTTVLPNFTPTRYNLGKPDIGPFLTTILSKLEVMMQNSLYVNLLLTGLVTRLACYHQPLLRSFLLNHTLVFQPTVKSLVQVLSSVRHKVDNYAYTVKDFDVLLGKARQYLHWREDLLSPTGPPGRGRSDSNLSLAQISPRSREKKKSTFGDFFRSKPKRLPQPKIQLVQTGKGFRYFNRTDSPMDTEENPLEALKTKNAVYCALVLDEFLKELAALSQEHAVLSVSISNS